MPFFTPSLPARASQWQAGQTLPLEGGGKGGGGNLGRAVLVREIIRKAFFRPHTELCHKDSLDFFIGNYVIATS
jgi:hypothetical protein